MGKWNINDLDKSKTEQSIANEQARLIQCKLKWNQLEKEANRYYEESENKRDEYHKKLNSLLKSIESGENFVNKCKEHLKDFENAEIN